MLAQQLANGIVLGATYALFAIGFTLIFGVLGVINLAYGFYFSVGAFAALWGTHELGLSIWTALPFAAVVSGLTAAIVNSLLLTPLRKAKAPELSSLMVTIGGTIFLYSGLSSIYGTQIRRFPPSVFDAAVYEFGSVRVTSAQLLIVAACAVLVAALLAILKLTKLGLAMRAVAERPDTAALMGVNALAVTLAVSFISGAIGGIAGVLIGLNFNAIQPYMGEQMMLRGFSVIIIGGLGDLRGAVLAGLLLGLVEVLAGGFISSSLRDAIAFALLVVTLWVRPIGLFGRAAAKRA